jgi:hypothetical protein
LAEELLFSAILLKFERMIIFKYHKIIGTF